MSQRKQQNSLEKYYKYYLFYEKDDGSLYAYTNDKKIAKIFQLMRKKELFVYEEKKLNMDEIRSIFDVVPDTLLEPYDFYLGDLKITFPITTREKLHMEHMGISIATVDLYCSAKIPPEIFEGEMKEALDEIGYTKAYREYHKGSQMMDLFKPDFLSCFLDLFGYTLNDKVVKR